VSGNGLLKLTGTDFMEKGRVNYTSEYIIEEPDAVVPHVRICVGAVQVTGRSTMTFIKFWLDASLFRESTRFVFTINFIQWTHLPLIFV
jgi:hypothetical protein